MNTEAHKRAIKESLEVIKDSIQKGLQTRQSTIGFHCSAASANLLEMFLHQKDLINPGANIKHNWFASVQKAKRKLDFDFSGKERILNLIVKIEEKRNLLCYGKQQPEDTITDTILLFDTLRKEFKKEGLAYEN